MRTAETAAPALAGRHADRIRAQAGASPITLAMATEFLKDHACRLASTDDPRFNQTFKTGFTEVFGFDPALPTPGNLAEFPQNVPDFEEKITRLTARVGEMLEKEAAGYFPDAASNYEENAQYRAFMDKTDTLLQSLPKAFPRATDRPVTLAAALTFLKDEAPAWAATQNRRFNDAFTEHFRRAFGFEPQPYSPANLANFPQNTDQLNGCIDKIHAGLRETAAEYYPPHSDDPRIAAAYRAFSTLADDFRKSASVGKIAPLPRH